MLKLGVNVDHVATVRQARGTNYPDPVEAAKISMDAGADIITMHLREDRRHIQDRDIRALRALPHVPLNLEMACIPEMVAFALEIMPDEVCLVPEKREELTTEGGLDVAALVEELAGPVECMKSAGIMVSLFVEPDVRQLDAAVALGAPCVELHTGTYAEAKEHGMRRQLDRLIEGARYAKKAGLQVNAGHGLHLGNIGGIMEMPHLDTLNIGHSIVARSLMVGMACAVKEMIAAMTAYKGGIEI